MTTLGLGMLLLGIAAALSGNALPLRVLSIFLFVFAIVILRARDIATLKQSLRDFFAVPRAIIGISLALAILTALSLAALLLFVTTSFGTLFVYMFAGSALALTVYVGWALFLRRLK